MTLVYKNTGAEFLDDLYSGDPSELQAAFERGLGLMNTYAALSGAVGQLEGEGELKEGTKEEYEAGWLYAERLLRSGYKAAIDLASTYEEPKPIETFFVAGASDEFELHICEGKYAVTVFMLIPPTSQRGSKRARSNSWVVRAGDGDDEAAEVLDAGDPPIVRVRVSGLPQSQTAE